MARSSVQANLELAKWVALAAMVIDHFGKIVEPDLYEVTHAIGRVSFPLFATIIGMRLALQPQLAATYVRRLLPWALISQPVYVFVGRDWYDGNILATLLIGVLATMLARDVIANRSTLAVAGILALLPVAWYTEFSVIGAALIPITVLLACWRKSAGLNASGPLGVAANFSLSWPPIRLIDLSAILATLVIFVSIRSKVKLPRLPALVFYAFYPAHLLALHFIDVALWPIR